MKKINNHKQVKTGIIFPTLNKNKSEETQCPLSNIQPQIYFIPPKLDPKVTTNKTSFTSFLFSKLSILNKHINPKLT